jgi:hypothetical protein
LSEQGGGPALAGFSFLQFSVYHTLETRSLGVLQELAIYEYCGDSSNTSIPALLKISVYQPLYRRIIHVFVKPFQVKPHICCKHFKRGSIQLLVILEKLVVVIPEPCLPVG